jgi:hypothetical protein
MTAGMTTVATTSRWSSCTRRLSTKLGRPRSVAKALRPTSAVRARDSSGIPPASPSSCSTNGWGGREALAWCSLAAPPGRGRVASAALVLGDNN